MGLLKRTAHLVLAALAIALAGCQPADDSELMSPENDIIVTSPQP